MFHELHVLEKIRIVSIAFSWIFKNILNEKKVKCVLGKSEWMVIMEKRAMENDSTAVRAGMTSLVIWRRDDGWARDQRSSDTLTHLKNGAALLLCAHHVSEMSWIYRPFTKLDLWSFDQNRPNLMESDWKMRNMMGRQVAILKRTNLKFQNVFHDRFKCPMFQVFHCLLIRRIK